MFTVTNAIYDWIPTNGMTSLTFSSQDGTRTNTFFQMSRDSFIEMQQATADVRPGLTHAHFVVGDLSATLARLRQAGLSSSTSVSRILSPT